MAVDALQPARAGQHTPDPVCNCCRDGDHCAKRTPAADGCRDLRPIALRPEASRDKETPRD